MNFSHRGPTGHASQPPERHPIARGGQRAVVVNGRLRQLSSEKTVAELVAVWCTCAEGVAVARNGEIVPRSQWALTELQPGDKVEIVTAVAGG